MYLIINSPWILEGQSSASYANEKLKRLIELNPLLETEELTKANIEEILVYGGRKEDQEAEAIICKCKTLELTPVKLVLSVSQREPAGNSSRNIKDAIYAYWMQSGKIHKGDFSPYLTVLDDYPSYAHIKSFRNRTVPMNQSWMARVSEYKSKNQWQKIVDMIPNWNTIETLEVWNSDNGLGEIALALSQILHRLYSEKKNPRKDLIDLNTQMYIKVIDRALEINPESALLLTGKAYFFYDRYSTYYRYNDYISGMELYKALRDISFVNHYRRIRMQHRYLEWYCNQKSLDPSTLIEPTSWDILLQSYGNVIERYHQLSEQDRKWRKKEYIRSLYRRSIIMYDQFCPKWDAYFMRVHFHDQHAVVSPDYEIIKKQLSAALKLTPQGTDAESANAKPDASEIYYRLAQLYLSEGICNLLNNKIGEPYFLKAVSEAKKAIDFKNKLKQKGISVKPFWYYYTPLSQSLFLLDRKDEAYRTSQSKEGWQKVDLAQMYILDNKIDLAQKVLKQIQENDISYKTAKSLLSKIGEIKNANS